MITSCFNLTIVITITSACYDSESVFLPQNDLKVKTGAKV